MQVETQHYELCDFKNCLNLNKKPKLDECIKNIAKKEGYISCDVTKKAIPADGGNYLAVLYEIDIKGKTDKGDKETPIFVKSMTPDAIDIEVISLPDVYKTELFMYNELKKVYEELQNTANVPITERYNMVRSFDESHDQAIIMENVTRKGFKTWYRMNVVSLEMAEECIKQLARFHGLSFVLEQKNPEYFENNIKSAKKAFIFGKTMDTFMEKFCNIGLNLLDKELKAKVEKKALKVLHKMEEYLSDASSMYCLCHGDYRPNNILVKEVDGKVTEVIPVDYQLIYYGCPLLDFFYFIYMATDRQFRVAHMTDLKNLYYNSLSKFLQYFDMSAESVLPRKVFENLYTEKFDYGLISTFLYVPFAFVSDEVDIPDVTKEALVDADFQFDERYTDRLKDAVEEAIELGYL